MKRRNSYFYRILIIESTVQEEVATFLSHMLIKLQWFGGTDIGIGYQGAIVPLYGEISVFITDHCQIVLVKNRWEYTYE